MVSSPAGLRGSVTGAWAGLGVRAVNGPFEFRVNAGLGRRGTWKFEECLISAVEKPMEGGPRM